MALHRRLAPGDHAFQNVPVNPHANMKQKESGISIALRKHRKHGFARARTGRTWQCAAFAHFETLCEMVHSLICREALKAFLP
jgi:hypothetical protein